MGNKVPRIAAPPPPPQKCSKEKTEASTWAQNLTNTQRIYTEKKLAADQCSPEQAAARAKAGQGPSECQVNDAELNMARNDVSKKDAKWEQCYPEEATQRRLRTLREEAQAYVRQRRAEQREANSSFNTKKQAIAKLSESAKELYKTLFDKEKALAGLIGARTNLEQLERRERRLFLDSDPQGGTGGSPGVRTADDRVLLAFWITYGAALIAGTILILQFYGPQLGATDTKSKAGMTALVALIGYGLAYYFISYYG
jgi:hypothetical protein